MAKNEVPWLFSGRTGRFPQCFMSSHTPHSSGWGLQAALPRALSVFWLTLLNEEWCQVEMDLPWSQLSLNFWALHSHGWAPSNFFITFLEEGPWDCKSSRSHITWISPWRSEVNIFTAMALDYQQLLSILFYSIIGTSKEGLAKSLWWHRNIFSRY